MESAFTSISLRVKQIYNLLPTIGLAGGDDSFSLFGLVTVALDVFQVNKLLCFEFFNKLVPLYIIPGLYALGS